MNIGEVSTIVPEYLYDCWRWAADKEELLKGSELRINTVPGITHRGDCGQDYPTVQHNKTCPYCHSENTWLVQGNEVEIKEIEI